MKAYIQSKKTMILSLSIIAFLFLSAVVIALLFNDVTPAAMLAVYCFKLPTSGRSFSPVSPPSQKRRRVSTRRCLFFSGRNA